MSDKIAEVENQVALPVTEQVIDDFLFTSGNAEKLDDGQKRLFKALAIRNNLDPFKREIYPIPYYNKEEERYELSVVTGYEVYLKRAERSGKLSGWKAWTEGSISKGDLKALIEIHRKDWSHPFIHEVWFREYKQDNRMWHSKPITMLKKVVISQGFRLTFPDDVGGLPYTAEEIVTGEVIEEQVPPEAPEQPSESPPQQTSEPETTKESSETTKPDTGKNGASQGWYTLFIKNVQKIKGEFEDLNNLSAYYAVLGNLGYEHANEVRGRKKAEELYRELEKQLKFLKEMEEEA